MNKVGRNAFPIVDYSISAMKGMVSRWLIGYGKVMLQACFNGEWLPQLSDTIK